MTTAYHYTYFYSHVINHSIISISNSSDKNLLDQSDTSDKTYEQDTYHLLLPYAYNSLQYYSCYETNLSDYRNI
ncbi:hypothetical protein [uncultured Methanobrevibacter sp.]|uniref:hypothetical protein n=1 Tax=uncultured Methanobrevibacter sp. TaxID=253161 RepID=UPI0025DE01E9|nr:hypothetical protein [uncultured Methanobrevibacter sp.]